MIIEKIKKLLSLANSPNENEAKLAASKANEMLVKHNISMQTVQESNFEYIIQSVEEERARIDHYEVLILMLLRKHYFVEIGIKSGKRIEGMKYFSKSLQIFGRPENVEVAGYVYSYLRQTFPVLWREFKKNTGANVSAKKSYYIGLSEGISEVLEKTRLHVEQETGLMVINDKKLEAANKARCNGNHTVSSGNVNQSAKAHGYEHGKNVRIAKPITSQSTNGGLRLEAK